MISCLSSPQLTLPEGTQPRCAHTLTSCRIGERRIHATTFGGCPLFVPSEAGYGRRKLANTSVLEFGERNTFHCTIYRVVCSLTMSYCVNQLNRSLVDIRLIVCPASCSWLYLRGWLIQHWLMQHFISLIPRLFSCPVLIAWSVTDWMAWKNLSNTTIAPCWHSMFMAAIAIGMGHLWDLY